MRSGPPLSNGASVRPSALVTVLREQPARAGAHFIERDPDPGRGLAADIVEHMRGQPSVGFRHSRSLCFCREPQPRDETDLVQGRRPLAVGVVHQAPLVLREDRIPRVPPNAHDKRNAEFVPVGRIEVRETGKFLLAQAVEPEAALFGLRIRRDVGAGDLRAEFRMRADEGELLSRPDAPGDRPQHGLMQGFDRRVGAAGGGCFRDPGRHARTHRRERRQTPRPAWN